MSLILGVDPGSRKTGFGIIDHSQRKPTYVTSGVIKLPVEAPLATRLNVLFESLVTVISEYQPNEVAVEDIFMNKNAQSALKLGHARGAIMVAAGQCGLPVFEYEARKVKQLVAGSGNADKFAVQHMVQRQLVLPSTPQEDAADALAVALCHVHLGSGVAALSGAGKFARGRLRM
jgi:crossover junction endodeoxyribonuclease RuvC